VTFVSETAAPISSIPHASAFHQWPSTRFGRMPHRETYRALCNVDQFRRNISSIIVF
jgi:hypothetical protein